MKHASALLTGSILLLCAFSEVTNAPESFAQDFPYQYNIKVELVGFYASVFDRAGKLVNDLSQNDFILSENGKPQILSQFSREYISLSIIFLLDTSGSMDGEKLSNAGKSLLQFLKHLNRGDEAMLMEFRSKPWGRRAIYTGFRTDRKRSERPGRLRVDGVIRCNPGGTGSDA